MWIKSSSMDKRKTFLILIINASVLIEIKCAENYTRRFDCYPEKKANETLCRKRGCIWNPLTKNPNKVPACYYDDGNKFSYTLNASLPTKLGHKITLELKTPASVDFPYPDPFSAPTVYFEQQTEDRMRIKITDSSTKRYEVPVGESFPSINTKPSTTKYSYEYDSNPFSINVFAKRNGKRVKIWDTSFGAMMLSDQFLQLSTQLPTTFFYGIGENSRTTFKRDFSKWETIGMFTADHAPYPFHNTNLYGVHPFYMVVENDGSAHGVMLLNSNAMDVTLQPTPAITFRTIGGVLDFYFFFGPTPENVVQQYTELIGRPVMPSYWSLGFQLCRYGYNSLDEVKKTVARMSKYDIPQDIQYGDIDYMERQLDFTYDKKTYAGLPEYVRKIKKQGLKYITILDPAIGAEEVPGTYEPYELGEKLGIWIKDHTGNKSLIGKVWPTKENVTVNRTWDWDKQTKYFRTNATFPDWFHPNISSWWSYLIKKFHKTIEFDGLWIDMNEAANFVPGSIEGCPNNKYEFPPYKPNIQMKELAGKTLCMSALHEDGTKEYDYHSLFGWKQTVVTRSALSELTKKRGIVISRSTYPSSGKYAGHWLGDNKSAWPQMHESIIGMMDFSLFGIPYSGADICGFNEDVTEELCHRWTQLGAFYPMSRNHNGYGFKPQDPAVFGEKFAKQARSILHVRYTLLPYLYTLFYEAHTKGSTVVRPMFHVFPTDVKSRTIDQQFFWGNALLVTPVLQKDATTVQAYLPESESKWYDYFTGKEVSRELAGKTSHWSIPLDTIGLHVLGGNIIPTQEPANNTEHSRTKPMGVIVALNERETANGMLFWDDGDALESISAKKFILLHLNATKVGLTINVQVNGYDTGSLHFNTIKLLGAGKLEIRDVKVNGKNTKASVSKPKNDITEITNLNLPIKESHKITWSVVESKSDSREIQSSMLFVLAAMLTLFICLS
ncbi:sucrase-isomaltase, intestinal-like [Hydractinia symbiolongicarpus]|uniref:sucrase-isomaltase, intestinal-like n=1 Tax=Hydractinia symbiolongicarpus TaxID=13093 RepID=UPI00254B6A48|nr:sucrase-isomaltase, intestinal-like [Hydractinia symbiolongicarpus]